MSGDRLARGARSATFGPAKVSQAKWDKIWADEPETAKIDDKIDAPKTHEAQEQVTNG